MPQHETTRTDSDRTATTEPALPRRRIAIFAEAVTLAHVARPLALARGLDAERYDVTFVCDPRYADFLAAEPWRIHWIDSISGERFRDALAKGRPIYDAATLQRYVDDDLAVIDAVRPDVVVGDFRLSLSASARIAAIPYAAICSTYWSPYARQRVFDTRSPTGRHAGARNGAGAVRRVPAARIRSPYATAESSAALAGTSIAWSRSAPHVHRCRLGALCRSARARCNRAAARESPLSRSGALVTPGRAACVVG